jgi:hypothetical protein
MQVISFMTVSFKNACFAFALLLILTSVSCAPKQEISDKKVPHGIILPDTMAAIITDLQIVESSLRQQKMDGKATDSIAKQAFEMIFIKYRISREDLEKSTAYYQDNLETYEAIYSSVITRLTQIQTEINSTE